MNVRTQGEGHLRCERSGNWSASMQRSGEGIPQPNRLQRTGLAACESALSESAPLSSSLCFSRVLFCGKNQSSDDEKRREFKMAADLENSGVSPPISERSNDDSTQNILRGELQKVRRWSGVSNSGRNSSFNSVQFHLSVGHTRHYRP
jgi:hypothetical protein